MVEQTIYDYLQMRMPELQFCNPFIDKYALPNGDFATFNVISVATDGWVQNQYISDKDYKITVGNTQQKIYRVQLDFYGPNALNNCNVFRQTLQMNLQKPDLEIGLKSVSEMRNLTALLTDKKYQLRYNFDIELFIIDTVLTEQPVIEKATIEIVNRGNNNT